MFRTSEKRKFQRLNVYHLVKYRLISWPSEKGPVLASIKNISAGGVQLITDESLPVDGSLQMQISFPRLNVPIPCIAKIVWVEKIGKFDKFKYGLQFMEIDEFLRNNIAQSIELINKVIKERG